MNIKRYAGCLVTKEIKYQKRLFTKQYLFLCNYFKMYIFATNTN